MSQGVRWDSGGSTVIDGRLRALVASGYYQGPWHTTHVLRPSFWYQKLGRSRTMFYSSPETWMHVTQMQRCHWPPRFAYTFWSSKWTDEIGDVMFLVPVSCVSGVRNLDTSFWWPVSGTRNLGGELGSCAIHLTFISKKTVDKCLKPTEWQTTAGDVLHNTSCWRSVTHSLCERWDSTHCRSLTLS